jgi:hypothetical protein
LFQLGDGNFLFTSLYEVNAFFKVFAPETTLELLDFSLLELYIVNQTTQIKANIASTTINSTKEKAFFVFSIKKILYK